MASIGVPLVASQVEPYKNTKGIITLAENDPDKFAKAIIDTLDTRSQDKLKTRKSLRMKMFRNYNLKHETVKLLDFLEELKNG